MPSPFPGMDPYLEAPRIWPDVHHRLISEIQSTLNPALRPRYVARVELRVYISDEDDPGRKVLVPDVRIEKPKRKAPKRTKDGNGAVITEPLTIPMLLDEEIEEARLEIREVESDTLVTVIEVLSPTNKIPGAAGRTSFMAKRREILAAERNWVEIDLLRAGTPSLVRRAMTSCDYRILVHRPGLAQAKFWPVSLRQPLPTVGIPLRGKDPDVPLALGEVFAAAYDNGAYDLSVDYRKPPEPPLEGEDVAWAAKLLRERR